MADDSVLCSLRELHDLEMQRIDRETAEARARRETAARVAAEAERIAAEERRAKEAESERPRLEVEARARLDVDAEVSQATRESQRRVEALRAELEAVQSERRFLHERALSASVTPHPTPKSRGWAVGFALMSTIAMALAALLVVQSGQTPAPQVVIREVPVPVEVLVPEPRREVVEPAPVVEAAPEPTRPAVVRPRPRPRPSAQPRDALGAIDDCGDDPLCML